MKRGPKIIYLRRKDLSCCWVCGSSDTSGLRAYEADILNSKKILEQRTGSAPESFLSFLESL